MIRWEARRDQEISFSRYELIEWHSNLNPPRTDWNVFWQFRDGVEFPHPDDFAAITLRLAIMEWV